MVETASRMPLDGQFGGPTYVEGLLGSKLLLFIEINEIISSVIPVITAKQRQNLTGKVKEGIYSLKMIRKLIPSIKLSEK